MLTKVPLSWSFSCVIALLDNNYATCHERKGARSGVKKTVARIMAPKRLHVIKIQLVCWQRGDWAHKWLF
jgi:hypothetical protein